MNRIEVIQQVIDNHKFSNYLEIGTFMGSSLLQIRCKHKMAVDPKFMIRLRSKLKRYLLNPSNFRNQYFEQTSDDFFRDQRQALSRRPVEISLIDGLHTFRQSLMDVLNTLRYLHEDGLIVMHDCFPPNAPAAVYALSYEEARDRKMEGWTMEWCGDVYKTIIYLRRKYPRALDVCVLNFDYGLGIVRKQDMTGFDWEMDEQLFEEINQISYPEMMKDAQGMLNLKDEGFARKLVKDLKIAF